MTPSKRDFPPVERLVPHGPPMLLIDSIVEQLDQGLVCKAILDEPFVFLRDGTADIAVCVELMAQTIACYSGLQDEAAGKRPMPGLLVGVRSATFAKDAVLRVGDELRVTVRSRWVEKSIASFDGEVRRGDEILATTELQVAGTTPEMLRSFS